MSEIRKGLPDEVLVSLCEPESRLGPEGLQRLTAVLVARSLEAEFSH